MNRLQRCLAVLAMLAVLLATPCGGGAPEVVVFYRPWFVAKPFSNQWGWHWTLDRFDPDKLDATGQRQIASWYRPLIGPYDSADPVVLEYHLLLMKLAGVGGVIVDWHGPDDFLDYAANNARTHALFEASARVGIKVALCYEDQSIQQQVAQGRLAASNAVASAQAALLYAEKNFFNHPSYFRHNGRPLLLNFGPQFLKSAGQWETVFSVLATTNRPALFTEDYLVATAIGAFSWPPMWLGAAPGANGVLSVAALQSYLKNFEERAAGWPAFISSAFPRFHDFYKSAGTRDSLGYLGDRKGRTFRETLSRSMTNGAAFAMIVTWNDFGEGTMVEPTIEYGFRDLAIIQEQRRLHLEPGFPCTTNDLEMVYQLYQLRQSLSGDGKSATQLDAIATELSRGHLTEARQQLARLRLSKGSAATP